MTALRIGESEPAAAGKYGIRSGVQQLAEREMSREFMRALLDRGPTFRRPAVFTIVTVPR